MIKFKLIISIYFLLLLQECVYSQSLSFNIQRSNEIYSITDTIVFDVINDSTNEYVFKVSFMKFVNNSWIEVINNIFDEEVLINQKYPISISHRLEPDSHEIVAIPIIDLKTKKKFSSGEYRFKLSFREYNKVDGELDILESDSFCIKPAKKK